MRTSEVEKNWCNPIIELKHPIGDILLLFNFSPHTLLTILKITSLRLPLFVVMTETAESLNLQRQTYVVTHYKHIH